MPWTTLDVDRQDYAMFDFIHATAENAQSVRLSAITAPKLPRKEANNGKEWHKLAQNGGKSKAKITEKSCGK